MNQKRNYHLELLKQLHKDLANIVPKQPLFNHEETGVLERLDIIIKQLDSGDPDGMFEGQNWLNMFMTHNPNLAPTVPRELLWFFGGECLHFMPDDEIDKFQKLEEDEIYAEENGLKFDYQQAKASIFQQH